MIRGNVMYYYGLDIGGTKIELAVFDRELNQLYSERVNTPTQDYQQWLQSIATLVKHADERFNIQGKVGLGLPGFVNHESNLAITPNIPAANGKPILSDLSQLLDREVRAENDANCFALSESWAPENREYSHVLGLILGTGFGGGLVFNGKIHSGSLGMAGEVGHMQLNYHALTILGDNPPIFNCGCGNKACLDSYISGRGFELLYQHFYNNKLTAKTIIEHFYAQDKSAVEFVKRFIELAAASISNIITILDPDIIVLGGGLSNFTHLYDALPKALPKYLLGNAKIPLLKQAKYGDSGGVRGAAALFFSSNYN